MVKSITDGTVLNNAVKMPWLGFGVFLSPPGDMTYNSVRTALEVGYRHIDTAAAYENEADVGKAIRDSGVPRQEIFVTTKVWNEAQRQGKVLQAFDESRKLLGVDVIDLYLVHWPVPEKYVDTYKQLEKLYQQGKVRAIGVSNFMVHHLETLLSQAEVLPTVDQVEWHPWLQLPDLYQFTRENKIQLEAWGPLIQGQGGSIPQVVEIGKKYGKSWAQVLIRWELQRQVVTIPKSNTPSRIRQNSEVFDFELSAEDMDSINALDQHKRVSADPDNFDF
jgi:diketogulonate reductase-like aldo/keto reductase